MRADYGALMPAGLAAMRELQRTVDESGLDEKLVELVKIRASQLNGCAYCVDMHTKDAHAIGEDDQRLHLVAVWREAPCYTDKERAALAWCESLTLLPRTGAPEDVYEQLARLFAPREVVALTFAIVAINGWNRLAVGLRSRVGGYASHRKPAGHR